MQIDLTKIRVFVINCKDHPDRRRHITAQLSQLGLTFEIIEGISSKPGYIGCALSHIKILSKSGAKPPFIILEDDCSVTTSYQQHLNICDQADVVYLGVSTWGVLPAIYPRGIANAVIATRYSQDFLKLHNMLSSHAMLYLSERFVKAVRTKAIECLINEVCFDIGLAALQKEFLALTPNCPFFYQDKNYAGHEAPTLYPLEPIADSTKFVLNKIGGRFSVQHIEHDTAVDFHE